MKSQKLQREHERLDAEKARLRKALDGSFIQQILWGIRIPLIGFRFIKSNPGLLKWLFPPVFLGVVFTVVLAVTVGASLVAMGVAGLGVGGLKGVLLACAGAFVIFVLVFAALVFGMGGGYLAIGPLLEFFLEDVEERESKRLWSGYQQPPFSWGAALRNILLTCLHWVLWGIGEALFVVFVGPLPIIGVFVVGYVVSVLHVWLLTGDYVGTVRLWSFGDKLRFLKDRHLLFFGASVSILLIPLFSGVGILFMPFLAPCGIVGTTLMILWLSDLGEEVPADGRLLELVEAGSAGSADAVGQ